MVSKKAFQSTITQFFLSKNKKSFTQNGIFFKLCSKKITNTFFFENCGNTPKRKQCLLLGGETWGINFLFNSVLVFQMCKYIYICFRIRKQCKAWQTPVCSIWGNPYNYYYVTKQIHTTKN